MIEKTNDLISRADIPYHKQLEPMGNGQYTEVEVAYKDDIESLPSASVEVGEWIPVSERLPKDNKEVLISCEWGVDIGEHSHDGWRSEWINHYDDDNVIAWMPLPKPYGEDGEA